MSSTRKRGKENGRKSNVDYGVGYGNLFFVSKIIGGLRDEQQQKNRKEVHRQQRENQSTYSIRKKGGQEMKHFKDVHLVLEETEYYDEGEGIKVTLDTSDDEEDLDYDIGIDAVSEGGYSGCYCTMSLKDLIYKIKDIIPYEWLADIKEEKENDK